MSFGIVVKNYNHYNRAMGKYISSKRQYLDEMKRGGYVSLEESHRMAEMKEKESRWTPSKDCIDVCRELYDTSDRKKLIRLCDYPKVVEKMKEKGMSFDTDKLPKHYQDS